MTIQDIQEVAQFLKLKFKISLQWNDARITFYNIKPDEKMNSLSLEEQLFIWTPTIVFWNTEKQLRTVNDKTTFASVRRDGAGSPIGKEVNEDIEEYAGSVNPITIHRVYSIEFFCEYDMRWYPFDQQTCYIQMVLDGVLDSYAELIVGEVLFTGQKELTQYYVKMFAMNKRNTMGKVGIVVSVTFGRRLLGTFLTIFFPTILLHLIGHITNFFKPFFFEAVITVNLTSMLVLTTMFINVSNNLPKTSYIKMVDIWLLFNLILPCLLVFIHTYMDYLREEEEREINHHGKTVTVGENKEDIPDSAIKVSYLYNHVSSKLSYMKGTPCKFGLHQ